MELSKADPRNPQPGQVWERNGHERAVKRVKADIFMDNNPITYVVIQGHLLIELGSWRSWACPWWRRRKHWAKCVSWTSPEKGTP